MLKIQVNEFVYNYIKLYYLEIQRRSIIYNFNNAQGK